MVYDIIPIYTKVKVDGTVIMYWLYKPCINPPLGDCAMYFDHGVTGKYFLPYNYTLNNQGFVSLLNFSHQKLLPAFFACFRGTCPGGLFFWLLKRRRQNERKHILQMCRTYIFAPHEN